MTFNHDDNDDDGTRPGFIIRRDGVWNWSQNFATRFPFGFNLVLRLFSSSASNFGVILLTILELQIAKGKLQFPKLEPRTLACSNTLFNLHFVSVSFLFSSVQFIHHFPFSLPKSRILSQVKACVSKDKHSQNYGKLKQAT